MHIRNPETNEWEEVFLPPTGDTYPIGMYGYFAGDKVPANWLRCDGQLVLKSEYPELFNAIGTIHNLETDTDETKFRLPNVNLEHRTLVGSSGDGEFSVGNTMGEEKHTMTIEELAEHKHGAALNSPVTTDFAGQGNWAVKYDANSSNMAYISNEGGGQPFNIMQPSMAAICCIKAKQSVGIVGDKTDDINDSNENAWVNAKTVKEYVDNKAKRQIATVYLNNDVLNVGAKKIPFDVINSNSAELTLNNNGVKIGKGISKVLVSGNAFLQKKTTSYLWTHILVNSTEASISLDNTSTGFASTSHAPKLVDVKENDIIYLGKIDDDLGTIRGKTNTYLTIEVVE